MQAIVEDAREAGVTQAQMAALEASLAQGAMTYETLASLMPDFQECAAGVGAEVQIRPPQDEPGSLLIPDYAVFVDPDDEKAALSEDMRNSGGSAMSACYQGTELAVRRH